MEENVVDTPPIEKIQLTRGELESYLNDRMWCEHDKIMEQNEYLRKKIGYAAIEYFFKGAVFGAILIGIGVLLGMV